MVFFLFTIILLSGGFWAATKILGFFVEYLSGNFAIAIVALSPSDVVLTLLKMDLLLVAAVILPFALIFAVTYLKPALYPQERVYLKYVPLMYLSSIVGGVFGWLISIKVFIPYFLKFSIMIGVANNWAVMKVISFILFNLFAFILVFNSPFVFTILFSHNILKLKDIKTIRKYVILLSVIIGAIFSPPDIASQFIIAIPFYLLFEITAQYNTFLSRRKNKRKKKTTKKTKKKKRKTPSK